ncbi:MAG TPA: dockerin type I domain-containing protein [Trueperaceae bacterium]
MKRPALLGLLVVAGVALAFQYRVEPGGGPAGLADAVQRAIAAWASVEGAQVEAHVDEQAPNLIRYGDATLLGPDTVSLTLSRGGQAGGLRVIVNPEAPDLRARALLHEIGLLLGLRPARAGAMDPALTAGAAAGLTPEDRAALLAQKTSAPEDINRDGVVDFYDLATLAQGYGRSGINLAADINRDQVVDDKDLALLRKAYVFGPPSETAPQVPARSGGEEGLPPVPELGASPGGTGEAGPGAPAGAGTGGAGTGGIAPGGAGSGGGNGGAETGGAGVGGDSDDGGSAGTGTGGSQTGGAGTGGAEP